MQTYFSTFITGTGEIIQKILTKKPQGKFRILSLLDGLVIFETSYPLRDIRNIRYFNNSFVLLHLFKKLEDDPLSYMIKEVLKNKKLSLLVSPYVSNAKTFKIVTSLENQTVSVNRELVKKLEAKISANGLRVNIQNPDIELWFLARREGIGLFGLRITYPYFKDAPLEKGELRHQLAHILSLASQPTPADVVLDPFAGYGAIPIERAQSFPYKEIICVESNADLVKKLKKRVRESKKEIIIKQGDALKLDLKDACVDKIITDPPWGIFKETDMPLAEFYTKMLKEFYRVLKSNGIAVILIGNRNVFNKILLTVTKLSLFETHNILVSGKKASIFVLRKN